MRAVALLAALAATASCGYGFSAGGRLAGGVERVRVGPFENQSTEPELGVELASALRRELASRALLGDGGTAASIEGTVLLVGPVPTAPGGVRWRIAVEASARLRSGEKAVAERKVRREVDFPAGVDPLETEGRRAQAAARLASDLARELVAALLE
jgi:hypothetical protein